MRTAPLPERLGRYEIVSLLAQGGMAELFLARLPGIEGFSQRLVVKRVLPSLVRDHEFVQMFVEEARLAATLHHQNIVAVTDIGHDEGGYFFAMEYLHGADVGEILRTTTEMPLPIALEITRGACAGLDYAHGRKPHGIVHRDVSPQNLFVTFDGGIKLLDFGIAKAAQRIASHYTRTGTLRGKLPYMSPEQCEDAQIDRRSDVFSLAVVLWEMTVGERLYGANNESDFEVMKSIVEVDAPRPSTRRAGYPPALEQIVMRGLSRDRKRRFQTCDELQLAIEGFVRTTNWWVTAREVAAFMQATFAERAATSMRIETQPAGGEVVPFPWTRALPPEPGNVTVDLPKAAQPFTLPPPHETAPGHAGVGRIALVIAATVIVTIGALIAGVKLLGKTTEPAAGSSAPSNEIGSAGPTIAVPNKPAEDALWFAPDDYLVVKDPPATGRIRNIHVAKMTRGPDPHHEASFLGADGVEQTTSHYWPTHIAIASDLVIGTFAFCPSTGRTAETPTTKADAKQREWNGGLITDVAELKQGHVMVTDINCPVEAVRVADSPR